MEIQAPLVMAVLVTCDPGPWFEETLGALAYQDYPNLTIVVVDAASSTDPSGRVAAILPEARVLRLATNIGYAPSTNAAVELTRGATHLLLCHDDVAPAPDAVRLMVEEAFRSNAGIVAPKLVAWDQPDRLLQVGMSVTRGGAPTPRVERGELDQEQHDSVREVFLAPGAFTLVRSDLFATLGGFDPEITSMGEDVDLCWRAHLLGARVVVAPQARVRHLEALSTGARHLSGSTSPGSTSPGSTSPGSTSPGSTSPGATVEQVALARRHQLRTVLKCYRVWSLARILPQLVVLWVIEVTIALFTHRSALAGALAGSWRWNFSRRKDLRTARSAVQAKRTLSDHALSYLQVGVVTGILERRQAPSAFGWPDWHQAWHPGPGQSQLHGAGVAGDREQGAIRESARPRLAGPGPTGVGTAKLASGGTFWVAVAWLAVLVLIVFGSRQLATSAFPAVGQLAPWPSWTTFLGHFVSGWRSSGLGASAPAPQAFAFIGLAGMLVLGHMGFLQHLAVLGTLPVGALGAWYLGRPLGSRWARTVTMVAYAVIPLPYGALGLGSWEVLVAYAAAPWVLRLLLEAMGLEPYDTRYRAARRTRPGALRVLGSTNNRSRRLGPVPRCGLSLAVLVALTSAVAPSEVVVVLICAIGLLAGSAFAGQSAAAVRSLVVAVLGVLGAVILSVPWTLGLLHPGPGLAALGGPGSVEPAGVGQLLALRIGGVGVTPLAWGLVAAALLPLLVGQGWRFAWASRCWGVAVACWLAAWLGGKGWLGVSIPTGVLLAAASAAIALCVGLGVVAFQTDLARFRFGWRQLASLLAAAGVLVGTFSFLGATVGGRWGLPTQDYNQVLSWMPACATGSGGSPCQLGGLQAVHGGAFRVLWMGNPEALPMGSWSIGPGLAFATSENGPPDATSLLPPGGQGGAHLLAQDVNLATGDLTSRLGHLLAPLAVRYIVIPTQLDPAPGALALPPPPSLLKALEVQEDLLQLPSNPSILVFANTAWAPGRAELTPAAAAESASVGPKAALNAPLAGSPPVLPGPAGASSFTGRIPSGTVYLSAGSSRWQLTQATGKVASAHPAFGWATTFDVTDPGLATLAFRTPILYLLVIAIDCIAWLLALFLLFIPRSRHRRGDGTGGIASRASQQLVTPPVRVGS